MQGFDPVSFSLWLYGAQGATAIALGAIFAGYYRAYARSYLGFWAGSFFALALYHLSSGVTIALAGQLAPSSAVRVSLAALAQVAIYLHIALLVLGTIALARQVSWRRSTIALAVLLAVAVGLVCALTFLDEPAPALRRLFVRVGVRHLATGLSLLLLAFLLVRRGAWDRGLGLRTTLLAFCAYGLEQLNVFGVLLRQVVLGTPSSWSPFLGLVDLVCLAFVGLGLVIWQLDEERARADAASARVETLERYDALTGLINERTFRERANEAIERATLHGAKVSVLVIDLDRFELMVGSLRTTTGENALVTVAMRLQRLLTDPRATRPARLEGHRFALLLSPEWDAPSAERMARTVQSVLTEPVDLGTIPGRSAQLTASMGIAHSPDHGSDAEALLRCAHLAVQHARDQGGNESVAFSPVMRERAQQKIALENELRRAFERGEFVLHYQPLVRPKDQRLEGFEALVRWQHPERGMVPPGVFLGVAEEIGLLAALDAWVLDTACAQGAIWNRAASSPIWIAVNVTAHSLRLPDFNRRVVDSLMRAGLAPAQLDLEITESTALADVGLAISCLNDLREVGVTASLDDFGTGYSSFSQLRRLPVQRIKLDRSFIADPGNLKRDGAIVRGLVSLAHGLGLDVVVEGVETEEQLNFCTRAGCDFMQGWYFAPALPADACDRLVAERDVVVAMRRVGR